MTYRGASLFVLMVCFGCGARLFASTASTQAGTAGEYPSALRYYFISDLHIGGDGDLDICDFEEELIGFLREMARQPQSTELIIVGDAFGLWELTRGRGPEKLEYIASRHRALFEQFRLTGQSIRITLIPGNHDYDLACYPTYPATLAAYGIHLDTREHIERAVGDRRIWIEHGNQRDQTNAFPNWGDRFGEPVGYFITASVVAASGRGALSGPSPWLKDLESVYPTEEVPAWVFSNYFYREMAAPLRWCLLPFLLLFTFSVIAVAGRALENLRVLPTRIFHAQFKSRLGMPGRLIDMVIWINGTVIIFLLVLAVPTYFLVRDVRATLYRYGIDVSDDLKVSKDRDYLAAAKEVFEADPSVALFIYGHTHSASVRELNGRYVVNTGTWLKRAQRVRPRVGMLPAVYVSSYHLNYFVVSSAGPDLHLEYHVIPKKFKMGLTWLQRAVLLGKRPPEEDPIPPETLVHCPTVANCSPAVAGHEGYPTPISRPIRMRPTCHGGRCGTCRQAAVFDQDQGRDRRQEDPGRSAAEPAWRARRWQDPLSGPLPNRLCSPVDRKRIDGRGCWGRLASLGVSQRSGTTGVDPDATDRIGAKRCYDR